MKRVKRPIKSNIQIPSDREKIFSTEDISHILDFVREKTGYDIGMEIGEGGTHSVIVDEYVYSLP